MSLIDQAKQIANGARLLTEWLGSGGHPVERELAQQRADTCLRCPKNIKGWKMTAAIATAVKAQIELKNHLRLRVHGERSLHTCEACLCQLRLKIWTPLRIVLPEPENRSKYWDRCWLLRESNE
jgi:hypothetical protein